MKFLKRMKFEMNDHLRESVVLRELRKHDTLVAFVGNKDVTRRRDHVSAESSERGNLGTIAQDFVAEASTGFATVTVDSWGTRVLGEVFVPLHNLKVVTPDAKLHGGARLLTAHATMAPASQGGLASHSALEGATHTRPGTLSHGEKFEL